MHIEEISRARYDALVERHPEHTVFHTGAWLESVHEVYGTHIRYLGLLDGEQLLGAFPVFSRRMFLAALHGSPLPQHATPRLLPLLDGDLHEEFLAALDRWVRVNRIGHFQLC